VGRTRLENMMVATERVTDGKLAELRIYQLRDVPFTAPVRSARENDAR
jgi:hypothetical protein